MALTVGPRHGSSNVEVWAKDWTKRFGGRIVEIFGLFANAVLAALS